MSDCQAVALAAVASGEPSFFKQEVGDEVAVVDVESVDSFLGL